MKRDASHSEDKNHMVMRTQELEQEVATAKVEISRQQQERQRVETLLHEKELELSSMKQKAEMGEAQLSDAVALRRATLANKVPYCTNMSTAKVCLEGIKSLKLKDISVTSLQDI